MRRPMFALLLCAAISAVVTAQPQPPLPPVGQPPLPPGTEPAAKGKAPAPAPPIAKPEGPAEFEARFADDSVVKIVPVDPLVVVVTKYGKLNVPIADLLRLEVGFRYPDGLESKIEAAVTDLGSASFKDREEAEKTLLKIGEYSAPAVRRATKNGDPEVARRAETVQKKLIEKFTVEKLDVKEYDLLETADVLIRGRIEAPTIKVKTKQFGEVVLRLAELRAIKSTATQANEFTLDAGKYARPNDNTWYDTGVDVTNDQALEIVAAGQIDLNPGQPGQHLTTAIGNSNNGVGTMMLNGRQFRFSPGALVARIGADGQPFIAGANYKTPRATGTGRLYLKIAPSPWGGESTGNYRIKLKIGG